MNNPTNVSEAYNSGYWGGLRKAIDILEADRNVWLRMEMSTTRRLAIYELEKNIERLKEAQKQ
jgi:hypothetical protein